MMYDVIIEAGNSAAIERIDPDNELCEVYFVITFSGEGEIENGRGTYHFRSMATFPKSYGDPRGFITTGKPFHDKTAIKGTIDATSLEEACRKFFSEWPGDDFQLVGICFKRRNYVYCSMRCESGFKSSAIREFGKPARSATIIRLSVPVFIFAR